MSQVGKIEIALETTSGRHVKNIVLEMPPEFWDANMEQLSQMVGRMVGTIRYTSPAPAREELKELWKQAVSNGETELSFEDWLNQEG